MTPDEARAGVPWHGVKKVPRSTLGYGGGTMLLDKDGACIGIAIIFGKSPKMPPEMLDDALFALLERPQHDR